MKILSRHWIYIFLLVCSKESLAQTQHVKFDLITGANGISLGKINGMTRDKYGFMWFSDQSNRCIVRYDGNKMIRYQNIINDSNSLGGSYPEVLFADSSGIIWIGFFGMGLDRFDPQTNTFTHYRHNKDDPGSLSGDYLQAILVDHLGNIWIGSNGGLDLLDEKTGKFKHYQYNPADPSSISHNEVRVIYEDKAGELWVGCGWPWGAYANEGGLNHFNRKTGTFTRYQHDPKNPNSLIRNPVRAILEDSKGNFWIGTKGDGLHTMDRKTGIITRHLYNPAKPDLLSRSPLKDENDHITFIREDAEKNIWIGTFSNGIVRYDPETIKTTHYTNYTGNTGITKDTSSWWAHASPDGLLWLSTQSSNLYRVDLYNSIIPQFGNATRDGVRAFCEEPASVLWMVTQAGLVRKDLKNGNSKLFVHDPNNPNSLSSNNLSDITKDKRGDLWISTYNNGLNRFNPISKTFTRYFTGEGKESSQTNILVLYADKESTIWAGTNGGGVLSLDPNTGKLTKYGSNENDSSGIGTDVISSILETDSMYIWFGSPNTTGLYRMNRQTVKFKLYLPGLTIHCLYKDKDGIFWVGSNGGLFRYEKESDSFTSGTIINDALNIPNAYSIIGDNDNNLWIVSSPGIYKINQRRDHATLYGKESGIAQGQDFYERSSFKAQDGKLYFGNSSGYLALYPDKIDNKSASTQFYFTNFWLNNKEIRPGENSLLHQSIFETKEILLNHNQNVFSFGFSVVDFREGDKRVYYKLENYDNDWRTSGSDNKAEYYKVSPGKYVLHIKTINRSNGEWMEKSIRVIISPPWWTTWWAWCIYTLLFIALVFSIHRFQKERLIKTERAKAMEREFAQAKEIEKAYHELKATQQQLIQSEKMASLGELTAGIAHEIQNPLNFVNNFSELNIELADELQQELRAGNIDDAIEISNDIKLNEEKIYHHGKRAETIVKAMLQHSSSGSGKKEPTDLNALADEYLRLAYHGLRAKDSQDAAHNSFNAIMKTDFDESIGNINIIPQDIGRVILNLITNAFYAVSTEALAKVGSDYTPTVSVSTRKDGNNVFVCVKDNGPGIPQKTLEKIFQPFFTTKPTGQGTGLGLSLSYDIVKAHGGELKVETKEGEGSTFIIQIPV